MEKVAGEVDARARRRGGEQTGQGVAGRGGWMGDTKGKQKVKKWSKNRKRMKCGTENRWGKVRENGRAAEEQDVGKRWELEVGTRTVEKGKSDEESAEGRVETEGGTPVI